MLLPWTKNCMFIPSSLSFAVAVKTTYPTSLSSSTLISYTECGKAGALSFTSLIKIRTYAVSERRNHKLIQWFLDMTTSLHSFELFFIQGCSLYQWDWGTEGTPPVWSCFPASRAFAKIGKVNRKATPPPWELVINVSSLKYGQTFALKIQANALF